MHFREATIFASVFQSVLLVDARSDILCNDSHANEDIASPIVEQILFMFTVKTLLETLDLAFDLNMSLLGGMLHYSKPTSALLII